MLERKVVSHVELSLPSTEKGETRNKLQEKGTIRGRDGGGRDVSDFITIIEVVGIQGQNMGQRTNEGSSGLTAVIEAGEFALEGSTVMAHFIPLLNIGVTPVRDLNDFGQGGNCNERLEEGKC